MEFVAIVAVILGVTLWVINLVENSYSQSEGDNTNSQESVSEQVDRRHNVPSQTITVIHKHVEPKDKKASRLSRKLHCPSCRSLNVHLIDNTKKGFSVGKAIGGAVLSNDRVGSLAGFSGKRNKKPTFHCGNCGKVFKYRI